MGMKQQVYTQRERKAEEEIDNFLRQINGGGGIDILAELRQSALS